MSRDMQYSRPLDVEVRQYVQVLSQITYKGGFGGGVSVGRGMNGRGDE